MRPRKLHQLRDGSIEEKKRKKAIIQAKVEHLFRVFKCAFQYTKVLYRGLAMNKRRLVFMAGLVDLLRMKKCLLT